MLRDILLFLFVLNIVRERLLPSGNCHGQCGLHCVRVLRISSFCHIALYQEQLVTMHGFRSGGSSGFSCIPLSPPSFFIIFRHPFRLFLQMVSAAVQAKEAIFWPTPLGESVEGLQRQQEGNIQFSAAVEAHKAILATYSRGNCRTSRDAIWIGYVSRVLSTLDRFCQPTAFKPLWRPICLNYMNRLCIPCTLHIRHIQSTSAFKPIWGDPSV